MKLAIFLFLFSFSCLASDFKMVGTYLLEYSIFKIDVYQITYFKGDKGEKIDLEYKVDVKRKYSQEGWRVGLEHILQKEEYREKAQWLIENTVDVKKGDKLSILKSDHVIEIYKNSELLAKIEDEVVAKIVFEPWLGERPVSLELKNSLLNIRG